MPETPPTSAAGSGEPYHEDPWDCIRVFDRLTVGPVKVEPRRVVARYSITGAAGDASIDLIYRWEEDVFDPSDRVAQNVASVVASQVALNYGLFASEIRFDGVFDGADRRFLRAMAENTAREITVKKFLEHNPFLRGPAADLPAVKRKRYCRARLRFRKPGGPAGAATGSWSEDPSRHAVLSSGGKESLLTYGILRELGRRTLPIFVNESGRHWLTALNGYRHLATVEPGTARVWTNADRVFNWFLRQMPFVRQDFASVRSDEYPIRLWTVAVFLFGAIPLLRRHRVGRISIGDEFDTSRRARHRGISHYDGLYDQSHYFDRALTRYFQMKGYGVEQFSLLRCLSELLVQKTLAERYPLLWEHQVSCHAAHADGGRVRPCGRCEKCRRVVAMLVAIDCDPTRCGYTPTQIDECLRALGKGALNQENEGGQHLAYLLGEKHVLPAGAGGLPHARRRPEVQQLRFDPRNAVRADLPVDLRAPLFRVLLEHANGAVNREKGSWREFDPLADPTPNDSNRRY